MIFSGIGILVCFAIGGFVTLVAIVGITNRAKAVGSSNDRGLTQCPRRSRHLPREQQGTGRADVKTKLKDGEYVTAACQYENKMMLFTNLGNVYAMWRDFADGWRFDFMGSQL